MEFEHPLEHLMTVDEVLNLMKLLIPQFRGGIPEIDLLAKIANFLNTKSMLNVGIHGHLSFADVKVVETRKGEEFSSGLDSFSYPHRLVFLVYPVALNIAYHIQLDEQNNAGRTTEVRTTQFYCEECLKKDDLPEATPLVFDHLIEFILDKFSVDEETRALIPPGDTFCTYMWNQQRTGSAYLHFSKNKEVNGNIEEVLTPYIEDYEDSASCLIEPTNSTTDNWFLMEILAYDPLLSLLLRDEDGLINFDELDDDLEEFFQNIV